MRLFLCLVVAVAASGCASGFKDHYAKLSSITNCKASIDKIKTKSKRVIGSKEIEGELADRRCVMVGSIRSSYDLFQLNANDEQLSLDIKVFPKQKGFGFGGDPTMLVPVVNLVSDSGVLTFKNTSMEREKNIWLGDRYHFSFVLSGLKVGTSYLLVLSSDNSHMGTKIASQMGVENLGVAMITTDDAIFVGPFGDVSVKIGKYVVQ